MSDDFSEGAVRLHTGEMTAEPVLLVVCAALRRLRDGGVNGMLAFADVVALARDSTFVLPYSSQLRASREGLVDEGGRMERGVAEVVRASASGVGYDVQVLDPVTGRSPAQ
ncbi:hypothetical protein [Kitasatospora sp. NPDC058046]|uniref:hypothetical protein n=1 Tax=Kitasatospora sp. NPDC058046 TaxID=3346312 RepID=UPI0036D7D885